MNRNLGGILSFTDELDSRSGVHGLLLLKSEDQRLGSGRCAVTITPGRQNSAAFPEKNQQGLGAGLRYEDGKPP
jgi:hypothetical protein